MVTAAELQPYIDAGIVKTNPDGTYSAAGNYYDEARNAGYFTENAGGTTVYYASKASPGDYIRVGDYSYLVTNEYNKNRRAYVVSKIAVNNTGIVKGVYAPGYFTPQDYYSAGTATNTNPDGTTKSTTQTPITDASVVGFLNQQAGTGIAVSQPNSFTPAPAGATITDSGTRAGNVIGFVDQSGTTIKSGTPQPTSQSYVFTASQGQAAGSQVLVTPGPAPQTAGELLTTMKASGGIDITRYAPKTAISVVGFTDAKTGRETTIATYGGPIFGQKVGERTDQAISRLYPSEANYQDKTGNLYKIEYPTIDNGREISRSDSGSSVMGAGNVPGFPVDKKNLSTVRAAEEDNLKLFGFETGIAVKSSAYGEFKTASTLLPDGPKKSSYQAIGFSIGVFEGLSAPVQDPKGFIKGIKESIFNPIDTAKALSQQVKEEPERAFGQQAGQALLFKGVSKYTPQTVKNQIPRVTYEATEIATRDGIVTVRSIGVQQGTRGATVGTAVSQARTPIVEVQVSPGVYKPVPKPSVADLPFKYPEPVKGTSLSIGTPDAVIGIPDLAKPVATPVSVGGAKAVGDVLGLTDLEKSRISSASKVSEILQADKGMVVKNPVFNVENIPEIQRPSFSKVIDTITGEEKGVFFGSSTTQQLPTKFSNKVVGDVDVYFPDRTKSVIENQIIPKYVSELKKQGIEVRQSQINKAVIEDVSGNKILEAKSGVDFDILGPGEELALPGFSGVRFADIKGGGTPDTVRFGSAKAITAGEQTARKGAASSFINPPLEAEGLPGVFSEGGVFGKVRLNEPRTLKDTAGFIQGAEGILALRTEKNLLLRSLESRSTVAARRQLETYKSTFTPEQLAAINEKLTSITGEPSIILTERTAKNFGKADLPGSPRLVVSGSPSLITGSTVSSPGLVDGSPVVLGSPIPAARSPFSSPASSPASLPSLSPSPLMGSSASPRPSPSPTSSPRLSPQSSPSTSPSPASSPAFSPSPISSPRFSPSPSTSPNTSPSPRQSPSPTSSPTFSPSPRPSPRPSPGPSPSPYTVPSPSIEPPVTPPKPGRNNDNSKRGGSYRVAVRKRGKFMTLATGPLSIGEAFRQGRFAVENTAAASFKVVDEFGRNVDTVAGARFLPIDRYRQSKADRSVFVQKEQYRISTIGEKAEIPGASRVKKRGFSFR